MDRVQDDIADSLRLDDEHLFKVVHPFNRQNLYYEVSQIVLLPPENRAGRCEFFGFCQVRFDSDDHKARRQDVLEFINKLTERTQKRAKKDADSPQEGGRPRIVSGIIYCRGKKTCDELSSFLRGKGINAAPFHRCVALTCTRGYNPVYNVTLLGRKGPY